MSNKDLLARAERVFMNNVGRLPLVFTHGKGSRLYDADGREYIDFLTGIAVASLGHSNQLITEAMQEQAEKLVHVSNFFLSGRTN